MTSSSSCIDCICTQSVLLAHNLEVCPRCSLSVDQHVKLPEGRPAPKVIFVLIDGIGDTAVSELGNKTPLAAANTPNMDKLAVCGYNGQLDPVYPGVACGSDTAHLSLLGYPPRDCYRGRGAFETMGAGLDMVPGDIAFKCNFATIDDNTGIVTSRRADRSFEREGPILSAALNGIKLPSFPQHTVAVKYATEHRCAVRIRGPGLSDNITCTDPLKDNLPLRTPAARDTGDEAAVRTAHIVLELSNAMRAILKTHAINKEREEQGKSIANVVLLRGCGVRINVPSTLARHGVPGFMIAPTCIIAGLGMCVGLDVVPCPGATGDYHTSLPSKGECAVHHIKDSKYTMGFVHIKAVDDAGHDKNLALKTKFLQLADQMIGQIIEGVKDDDTIDPWIVLTGDHSTPVLYGDHSHEPVPFVLTRVQDIVNEIEGRYDTRTCFQEVQAHRGALGRFTGDGVMPTITSALRSSLEEK